MATKKISQVEARALKWRVAELEAAENNRRLHWVREYPGGTHIASLRIGDATTARIQTARKLDHAVVVTEQNGEIHLYALPNASGR